MAYGAKFYGPTGALQIDDTYETYVYAGNYSLTPRANGGDPNDPNGPLYPVYHNSYVDIVSTSRPIIFYKPPASVLPNLSYTSTNDNAPWLHLRQIPGVVMVALINTGGDNWRGYFVSPWIGGSGQTQLKVFVSTKSKGPSTESVGMRLFDPAGTLLFDSGWQFLNPQPREKTFKAIQANISNVVGTTIQIYASYQFAFEWAYEANTTDLWISMFAPPPTVLGNLQPQQALYYTYIFKVLSIITGPSGIAIWAWPAIVNNSTFPSYNIFLGSNVDPRINYLVARDMSSFYP